MAVALREYETDKGDDENHVRPSAKEWYPVGFPLTTFTVLSSSASSFPLTDVLATAIRAAFFLLLLLLLLLACSVSLEIPLASVGVFREVLSSTVASPLQQQQC